MNTEEVGFERLQSGHLTKLLEDDFWTDVSMLHVQKVTAVISELLERLKSCGEDGTASKHMVTNVIFFFSWDSSLSRHILSVFDVKPGHCGHQGRLVITLCDPFPLIDTHRGRDLVSKYVPKKNSSRTLWLFCSIAPSANLDSL